MADDFYAEEKELKEEEYRAAIKPRGTIEETGNKIKAGVKAVTKKIKDNDKDLGIEYKKAKLKEDLE